MSLLPEELPRYEEMGEVVKLHVQNVGPYAIAKKLGIRKVDVDHHIEEWRKSAVGNELMKDRVEELIASMDQHYSQLITKAYEIIDEVDVTYEDDDDDKAKRRNGRQTMTRSQMLSQKLGAIKTIADLESKRIDVLQKSGLLEAADIGDQLAELEEQKQELFDILDKQLCPVCRPKILGQLAGENASVVVVQPGE